MADRFSFSFVDTEEHQRDGGGTWMEFFPQQQVSCDGLSASQRPSLTGEDMLKEITAVLAGREPLHRHGGHYAVCPIGPAGEIVRSF